MICQSRSSKQNASPLLDISSYPFQKISMDISGPYGEMSQGNMYIVSFVDRLSNWPEDFAVSDKRVQTIVDLIRTKIFPRYEALLQLVTDNGKENVNEVTRETLQSLNIQLITTSPYHPQINAKVERFHRFLGDVLSKLTGGNSRDWDLQLNQALAAVRFSKNETTQFSPYFMLFGRNVILHIDNLLKPQRKYMGEDHHKLILEHQHKTYSQGRRKTERAQKKRNKRVNQNRKEELGIGDPEYYKVHARQGKLGMRWRPYYRIVRKTGPVSFIIWDQIRGTMKRAHANDLKLAEIEEWKAPKIKEPDKTFRRPTWVVPPPETDSDDDIQVENIPYIRNQVGSFPHVTEAGDSPSQDSEGWETEDEIPLTELRRVEKEKSSAEGEVPLKDSEVQEKRSDSS